MWLVQLSNKPYLSMWAFDRALSANSSCAVREVADDGVLLREFQVRAKLAQHQL
jgi:hypothetical protein